MFFNELAAFGDRAALVDGDRQWTYQELVDAVSAFAGELPSQ